MGALASLLLACAGTGAAMPAVAFAAPASGATLGTVPAPNSASPSTLTPAQLSPQQLASTLMQTISQFDQVRAALAQNEQQLGTVQAQIRGDEAGIRKLNRQINGLAEKTAHLTARERQERAQLAALARAIDIDPLAALLPANPPSVLVSVLETGSLGSYLSQNPHLDLAVNQAQVSIGRLDSQRRQAQASRVSLKKKRAHLTADEQQTQASQTQLQSQATQLQTQEAQVAAQWSQSMTAVAGERADATLSSGQTAQMAALGTEGLDQQTLNAAVAAGMYTLTTSTIQWPAVPDPTPLGLAAYPSYCQYTPVQCTCYAANAYQKYTGGSLPAYLGNGGQWISGAQANGLPTTQTPSEGSVVVFNGPDYSVYGHVALVRSVIYAGSTAIGLVVWERNFDEMGGFDVRMVALGSGSEIAGYIPPGV